METIIVIIFLLTLYLSIILKKRNLDNFETKPTLSYCITCMNRFHQLKNTLRKNLDNNKKFEGKVEFILVNFIKKSDKEEGLKIDNYVKNNFKKELKSGYLKYYVTNKLDTWHASIAKNTSHKYANGLLVYNLDCDNFVLNVEIEQILNEYKKVKDKNKFLYFGWSEVFRDGTAGRVCTTKKQFLEINGYNQYLKETGYEDFDVLKRIEVKYNINHIKPKNFINTALQNDKDEGVQNITSNEPWKQIERHNYKISKTNIKKKIFRNKHDLGVDAKRIF